MSEIDAKFHCITLGVHGELPLKIRILQKLAILTLSAHANRLTSQLMGIIDAELGPSATRLLQKLARYIGCPWQPMSTTVRNSREPDILVFVHSLLVRESRMVK